MKLNDVWRCSQEVVTIVRLVPGIERMRGNGNLVNQDQCGQCFGTGSFLCAFSQKDCTHTQRDARLQMTAAENLGIYNAQYGTESSRIVELEGVYSSLEAALRACETHPDCNYTHFCNFGVDAKSYGANFEIGDRSNCHFM